MHTRSSHRLSPLAFDPEIDRTLRRNRVLIRENKVLGSPTTPMTTTMDPATPKATQPSTQPSQTTPSPVQSTLPPIGNPSTQTTLPPNTQSSTQPTQTVPPFSHFFPNFDQPLAQTSQLPHFQPSSSTIHTTSQTQPLQPRTQYHQHSVGQPMGTQAYGNEEDYEGGYMGYEEEGYYVGDSSAQMGYQGGYEAAPQQQFGPAQGVVTPPPRYQQGPQYRPPVQRQVPPPPPYVPPPPPQYPAPRPVGQMGPPRAPMGVPRRHLRDNVRGIEAHFRPVITHNPSPVVIPTRDGRTFEVRTNSLQALPKFKGQATEEPYFHLESYDSICNTLGSQGFTSDEVKLVLFQFSLEDKAKRWFYTLPSSSIYTWGEMQQRFLEEFFTAQKTNDARRNLRSFQQQQGEMFHEAFERFNMMIKNCPHHGIELWELMNAFHEGLSLEDARDLMSITNGTFGTNYEYDDWAFLEQLSVTSKRKAQTSRRARPATTRPQVHAVEDSGAQAPNQVYNVCANCNEIGHGAEACDGGQGQYEEVNALQGGGGRNYNMNSNNYHPGMRNHPNLRYGNPANQLNPNFQGSRGNYVPRQQYANQNNFRNNNQQGYQGQPQTGQEQSETSSSGNEVMDMLRAMQQDMQKRNQMDEVRMQKDEVRDKSIRALTTQMGQLASEVAELKKGKGQLPSDTKVNPSHFNTRNAPINHVSVLRSGKEF